MKRILHRAHHRPVHHLHRGRQHSGGDDVADRVTRIGGGGEGRDHGAEICGFRHEANPEFRDDSERALAAADQAGEIERAVFAAAVLPAAVQDRAIAQHHLDAKHMIAGDEILEGVNPPGIGGGIPTDGAGPLAGRVRGKVVRRPTGKGGHRFGQRRVPHTRLHMGHAIFKIYLQDAIHLHGGDDDSVRKRHASPGQPGARSARDDLHPVLRKNFHDRRNLFGGRRKHHGRGPRAGDGEPVKFVDEQFRRIAQHPIAGQHRK